MTSPTRAALWGALLAAAWAAGSPALLAAVAWWFACLRLIRPATRRLGPRPRAALTGALVAFALAVGTLATLARSGALDGLATPADRAAAERRAAVARSIATTLAEREAAWRDSQAAPGPD